MPPKDSAIKQSNHLDGRTKQELEAINKYLDHKPDVQTLIAEAKANTHTQTPAKKVATTYDKLLKDSVRHTSEERLRETEWDLSMPILPKEEGSGKGECA